jgi:GH15 family glucan-1,4-alpha-glucosidase
MARPAGGLAPGASWRRDGISWTNATASRAMTAAFIGQRNEALVRLQWLDQHRTAAGSLPEKVLSDGQPAAVAPLAWTAAAVVITADALSAPQ